MISVRGVVVAVSVLLSGWSVATAADPDPAALKSAVEKNIAAYQKGFEARDPAALVALFTPEAEFVDFSGTIFHGRQAIQAELAANFAGTPAGQLAIDVVSIRPIAQGVMVEDGVTTFQPKDPKAPSYQVRYTATHVQQKDGSWLLASIRELDSPQLTAHDRLKALAWLEGAWREEAGGESILTEWKWSEDGNFLISEFTVRDGRGVNLKGTQRVGWDAERNQFRSWIFNSMGATAEGWWSMGDDGTWTVEVNGVDPEGARTSGLLNYDRDGADGLIITQDQRTRGGIRLPSSTHRVVRQPPAPAKHAAR